MCSFATIFVAILLAYAATKGTRAFVPSSNQQTTKQRCTSGAVLARRVSTVHLTPHSKIRHDLSQLHNMSPRSDDLSSTNTTADGSVVAAGAILGVAVLYWLYLVFGAAAASVGIPVPDFIPLVPGWPPSDADLAPALEDSAHFFYIKDLLDSAFSSSDVQGDTPPPPVVRLALFNVAEAWVFAFLPVLLADTKRLPLPVVLFTWTGALGLTNAFLAPYLSFREGFASFEGDETSVDKPTDKGGRNAIFSVGVGFIASTVAVYAAIACITGSSTSDWLDFAQLVTEDRTYLAFSIDLLLFSIFQPYMLNKLHIQNAEADARPPQIYNVPFVGLMAWLFGV